MMKYEFMEHVNSIREERGYNLLSDIPEQDYAVVEKVYTFHPMFDVRPGGENPKRLIASIYTLYRATCNGMALIRALLPQVEQAIEYDKQIDDLRQDIAIMQKRMNNLFAERAKLRHQD